MLDDIKLNEITKLEIVNYGLNPELTHDNHAIFYMEKVVEELQNG